MPNDFTRMQAYINTQLSDGGFPKIVEKYYAPKLEAVILDGNLTARSKPLAFQFASPFEVSLLEAIAVHLTGSKSSATRTYNILQHTYERQTGHFKMLNAPVNSPLDLAVQLGRWHPGNEPSDMTYYLLLSNCPDVGKATIAVLTSYLVLVGMPLNEEFGQAAFLRRQLNKQ